VNFDELIILIDAAIYQQTQRHLRDIDVLVLRESLDGKSYDAIAEENNYAGQYLRQDVGPKLWQLLSTALQTNINKKNCRLQLERFWQTRIQQTMEAMPIPVVNPLPTALLNHTPQSSGVRPTADRPAQVSWGEAADVSYFYGREAELAELSTWIQVDRVRVIALLGMGGIGKTALSVRLCEQLQDQFEWVVWRSLRNAPPVEDLLYAWMALFFQREELRFPARLDDQITLCLEALQKHRCLLVLDNWESILQGGQMGSPYSNGYEGYGHLIRTLSECQHQSCLVITSREKPLGFAQREGPALPTRSRLLSGLTTAEVTRILLDKGIEQIDPNTLEQVLHHYAGNPLAIKIVAAGVAEMANGDFNVILPLLNSQTLQFRDLNDLLSRQFSRLGAAELQVMYWLAINRDPVSLRQLEQDIPQTTILRQLPEATQALARRSLLERTGSQLSLQPVVMEYVTQRLASLIVEEIINLQTAQLQNFSLIQAQAKDYIRQAQTRFIVAPILAQCREALGSQMAVTQQLQTLIAELRQSFSHQTGYAGGNVINMLAQLQHQIEELDCSSLAIRRAYLADVPLYRVNFAQTDLTESVFSSVLSATLAVSFSPNGDYFAMGNADNRLRVWNFQGYREHLTCSGHRHWVSAVAFSPDDQLVVSGSFDKTLKLWDLDTGACIQTLEGHTGWIWDVIFSPDGTRLASCGDDHTVRVWDRSGGKCLQVLTGHQSTVWSLAFSPDGNTLASCSGDMTVKLWDIKTGQAQDFIRGRSQRMRSVAISPNGLYLATGGIDHSAELWDINSGECLRTFKGHSLPVTYVTFAAPNGSTSRRLLLATGSQDCSIRLWDAESGECLRILKGHPNGIWSLAFHPTAPLLISGSNDSTVKLWNTETGQSIRTLLGHSTGIKAIALHPTLPQLVSAGDNAVITQWDLVAQSIIRTLRGHGSWIWDLVFTPNGEILASCSNDNTIRLWSMPAGTLLKILKGHKSLIFSVAVSADSRWLVSGSDDQTVRLWEIATGTCVRSLPHPGRVWSVAIHPAGTLLASGNQEQTLTLWDVESGELIDTLEGHTSLVFSLAFNATGTLLASGSDDGTVCLWDVESRRLCYCFQGHRSSVWSVQFNSDGSLLATGSNDATVRLWDVAEGGCVQTLYGHTTAVWRVAFHGEGWLASASEDGTIKQWDRQGNCFATFRERRLYEQVNLQGATGLTDAQRLSLMTLGAVQS
jgi:WD40 repeat protein